MMPTMQSNLPWSVSVRLEDIPETGKHVDLEAGEAVRAAVARAARVDAVDRLCASFDLSRHGVAEMRVAGHVAATVRQTCVVSLEPLVSEIGEAIDLVFQPPQAGASRDAADQNHRGRSEG